MDKISSKKEGSLTPISQFVFDREHSIYSHPDNNTIEYQDGGEAYILESMKKINDLSSHSTEFKQYIKDWPSRYHFSNKRINFLEAIKDILPKKADVLEIGSGCGIITRWLGEQFHSVDALEGNAQRAGITQSRTKDLDNVKVYCGNLLATAFDKKYDIIILIGSLEYIPLYHTEHDDPKEACKAFLTRLKCSLKEDGILLIAIENKLGAKYFCGCKEDHTGREFEGLIGYPDKTPVTFSRNEMQSLLSQTGFGHNQFYHVFPDYKLTESIIPENPEVLSLRPYNWIRTPFENYTGNRLNLFPDMLFLKSITDSGLLWQFSNSFVILASPLRTTNLTVPWLIKKYRNGENLDPKFHHEIFLITDPNSCFPEKKFRVNRSPLTNSCQTVRDKKFEFSLLNNEYISGELLILNFYSALFQKNPEDALKHVVTDLHNHLLYSYSIDKKDPDGYPLVTGETIDFTFWNLIVGVDFKPVFIDKKWRHIDPLPVDIILFRNLFNIFERISPFLKNKDRHQFIFEIIHSLYPQYSEARLLTNLELEKSFQSFASGQAQTFTLESSVKNSLSEIVTQNLEMTDRIESQTHYLSKLETDSKILNDSISVKDYQLLELNQNVKILNDSISVKDSQLLELSQNVKILNDSISVKDSQLLELSSQFHKLELKLLSIEKSMIWQFTIKFHTKIIEKLLPNTSGRRKFYDLGLKSGRICINEGLKKAYTEFKKEQQLKNVISYPQNNNNEVFEKNKSILGKKTDSSISDLHLRKKNEYVPLSHEHINLSDNDVKFIAFYLPQFHPIPENDRWWGKGFTEWTNVTKAVPQFEGHYQPHFPDELGYYDLRLLEVQKRQVELARQYGIYGFCFHYYWFNGKRLLEQPLNQILDHKEIDFPFCICWANENWTRRWDGMDNEILIAQQHSPESDLEFIRDLEPVLNDLRYIHIGGKPLVIVYRATLLPESLSTTNRWREYCRTSGIGEIYLVAALCFGCEDPRKYGFDAAVEFPPHTMVDCTNITHTVTVLNPLFSGIVFDYAKYVLSKNYLTDVPFKLFKTVSPGWDNTARRQNNASIFHGTNPQLYKEWLFNVAIWTRNQHSPEEQIVFINAWNEWAEGAYLEPDKKFGYGYLQATAEVILETRSTIESPQKKIIIVSHDAHLHGAQMLALHITKVLKEQFHYEIHLLLKSGGVLEEEFRKYAVVYNLEKEYPDYKSLDTLLTSLYDKGITSAICNTVVTGDIVELLVMKKIRTVSLIHELPGVIQQFGQEDNAKKIALFADRVIFPAEIVKEKFLEITAIDELKCHIRPQGLFLKNKYKDNRKTARTQLREILSLPKNGKIVLNVGYADSRKGIDLFVDVAREVLKEHTDVWFVWVGLRDESFIRSIQKGIEQSGISDRILFPGIRRDDIDIFYSGADIFLLTSREDPFPSVVIDAMNTRLPVIAFDNAGGFKDIITENTGRLVPYLSIERMADAVSQILKDPELQIRLGNNAADLIEREFNFPDYIYALLRFLGHEYKKISVILPSYNYESYLPERLESIFSQTYPVYEIIAIDDNSKDRSTEILRQFAEHSPVPFKVIVNKENSGSVFRQWAKGIALARGDYIWIAEADDLSDSRFLEEVMKGFNDDTVVLSYSQSRQIDELGVVIAQNYYDYTNEVDPDKWKQDYSRQGTEEICDSLVIKNTIPNVSAVVFTKIDISGIVEDLVCFKVAGDWFFYVWLLKAGSISYHAQSLNLHRRHKKSVTTSENAQQHFNEIIAVQDFIITNFTVQPAIREKVWLYREKVHNYLLK